MRSFRISKDVCASGSGIAYLLPTSSLLEVVEVLISDGVGVSEAIDSVGIN